MRDRDLDDLLDMAARTRPTPPAELMDRVLAEALAEASDGQQRAVPLPPAMSRQGWLARLAGAFGGGPVLAGVCSFLVIGLTVGYLDPTTLDFLTGGTAGAEIVDLFPTTEFLLTEG